MLKAARGLEKTTFPNAQCTHKPLKNDLTKWRWTYKPNLVMKWYPKKILKETQVQKKNDGLTRKMFAWMWRLNVDRAANIPGVLHSCLRPAKNPWICCRHFASGNRRRVWMTLPTSNNNNRERKAKKIHKLPRKFKDYTGLRCPTLFGLEYPAISHVELICGMWLHNTQYQASNPLEFRMNFQTSAFILELIKILGGAVRMKDWEETTGWKPSLTKGCSSSPPNS